VRESEREGERERGREGEREREREREREVVHTIRKWPFNIEASTGSLSPRILAPCNVKPRMF